ncbi:MAG: 2-C-methyl-D-erythritol 4-phosphate cytidylyltransferase [Blautia sp.]|nr:2-C-methyl-D-erythritol 4-phosphate cytidylyltransferase [Blautia sp.]
MGTNVFGVVLAGGQGTRMGNVEKPKQFLEVGNKPIIIHTLEKFVVNPQFERVIVLSPKQWLQYTTDIVKKYIRNSDRIDVIVGGTTRNDTVMNSIAHIEKNYGIDDDTIIVTHDSVRPFVTHRILEENISFARKYGACDTVIPATDTIVESTNSRSITSIPDRSIMYQGQTPQSFHAKKLRSVFMNLTEEEKKILTDACKILVLKGETVALVEGEVFNIKITYPYDLRVAESLLGGNQTC